MLFLYKMQASRSSIRLGRASLRRSQQIHPQHNTFYKANDLYKYDNKNVVYLAYIGRYDNEDIYKYGKSVKLFQREYKAHVKNFELFEMQHVYITDNKDIVEEIFKKELLIRNMNRSLTIYNKKQTELFATSGDYNLEYFNKMMKRIIKDNPSYEVSLLKEKIARLEANILSLKNIK
jgi:hypothetical protein